MIFAFAYGYLYVQDIKSGKLENNVLHTLDS